MTSKLFSVLLAVLFAASACSTHRASLNYGEFKTEMSIQTGTPSGEEVGTVMGSTGGAVWDQCDANSRRSVRTMIENAKAKGANAVGNLKWAATGTGEPGCKKSWGFVMLPVFLLTPLFMSNEVTGTAYKTAGKKAGLFMLPTNEAEEAAFIDAVVALQ